MERLVETKAVVEVPTGEVTRTNQDVITILEDVISKTNKSSFHGQRLTSDLGEGIRALKEGDSEGGIVVIQEQLQRPGIPKVQREKLEGAIAKLATIPKAETA